MAFDQPQTGIGDPDHAPAPPKPQSSGKQTGGSSSGDGQQANLRLPTIGAPPGGGPQMPTDGSQPVTIDAVMALLRDGAMRRFRIDIETDSTVTGNEAQDRQDRVSFITAITQLVEAWAPIVGANPIAAPLGGALMTFGARGFRVASELEDAIETFVDKMEQNAAQPPTPPQPDPKEMAKLQATQVKSNAEIQKAGIELQSERQKAQIEMRNVALEHDRGVMDSRLETAKDISKHQMELERMRAEHQLALAEMQAKAFMQGQEHQRKMAETAMSQMQPQAQPNAAKPV